MLPDSDFSSYKDRIIVEINGNVFPKFVNPLNIDYYQITFDENNNIADVNYGDKELETYLSSLR